MDSLSWVDSIAHQDLASQTGHTLPLEGQLVSLLAHGSLLQSMLLEMISFQMTACFNNLSSLPANSLSQAEHLASFRPTSPKCMAPIRVQKGEVAWDTNYRGFSQVNVLHL